MGWIRSAGVFLLVLWVPGRRAVAGSGALGGSRSRLPIKLLSATASVATVVVAALLFRGTIRATRPKTRLRGGHGVLGLAAIAAAAFLPPHTWVDLGLVRRHLVFCTTADGRSTPLSRASRLSRDPVRSAGIAA